MATRWTHVTITVSTSSARWLHTSFCDLAVLRDRRREGGGTVLARDRYPTGKEPYILLVIGEEKLLHAWITSASNVTRRSRLISCRKRATARDTCRATTEAGGSVGYFTMLRDPDGHLVEFTNGQPIEGLH